MKPTTPKKLYGKHQKKVTETTGAFGAAQGEQIATPGATKCNTITRRNIAF
jgi:hypothetical protein